MKLPECVKATEPVPGYPVYVIDHPTMRAKVALHGAQVMEWTPEGEKPVIYLSPDAVLKEGKAIRGGVPLCWPWFNAHPTDASKPSHGFARTRFWHLAEMEACDEGVRMVFDLASDDETRRLWDFVFELRVVIEVGQVLRVKLETRNVGETEFTIGEALHAYLAVGEVREVEVRGLAGKNFLDTVGEPMMRKQVGELKFEGEVDRQYECAETVTVHDAAWARVIEISKSGSGTTTVWNPWAEKAGELSDLPDDGYRHFVCVEAANAGPALVVVPPGGRHVIETVIAVSAE
ncbi:D-hexose-6-phosphate mutarotase [Phragmitibacter flavus]|nr:D-hexose-6-phosphate mutarotase [Phragmitibacter flavus]